MRLIDADKLMEDFRNTITEKSDTMDWLKMIYRQPTAYSVDKVIEELEKELEKGNMAIDFGEFRLFEIVKQGDVSDDVCEWHKVKNGNAYKCNTHAEIHDSRVLDWCKCPYCGNKIKIVGD